MKICQSCGMPMATEKVYGNNTNGSKSDEYCIHCYPKGQFNNPEETIEEMVESCVPFMLKEGHTEKHARDYLNSNLKGLKRWQ